MYDADRWISAEFQRLAEIIKDYDEHLDLEFIPVAARQTLIDRSQCYRIVDDRTKKIVLYASEIDNPVDILARLWTMDSDKGNVLARVDAHNRAVEAFRLRQKLDEDEANKDFSEWVFRNEKNYWIYKGTKRDSEFRNLGNIRTHIT